MILNLTESGAGEPLVLLHGLFGRSQNFGFVARRLAARFRVLSLDLRNHGASPHAPGMDYPEMAADVAETLQANGVAAYGVLGHSMGGKVGMVLALAQPSRVTRLLVADIAPVTYRHSNKQVANALRALPLGPRLTRAAAAAQLADTVPDPAVRAFLLQNLQFGAQPAWRIGLDHIAEAIGAIEGFPVIQDGRIYAGDTLFLRGAKSGYVKDEAWPAIRTLFPAATLQTLDGAGHWLHADQPEAFAAAVERFFT
jgi:pimeloyl-ACP methyl ester carboxylesterase